MRDQTHRLHLTDAEREQAVTLIGILIKIIHSKAPRQIEHALVYAGEFLLTRGNRDRTPGGFERKRKLLLEIANDCRQAVQS
jgi:hypothetical protein